MRAKDLVSVKFIRKNAPFNCNEIAGFPPDIAANLVNRKRAVYNVPEEEKASPAPEPKDEPAPPADVQAPPEPKAKPKAKARRRKKK